MTSPIFRIAMYAYVPCPCFQCALRTRSWAIS
ncbi:MAG: hypothetical protein ACI9ZF_002607 [Bradyrhizobium sp.]|jgi:hypothetical protein